ncbi:MAG: ABC transporter permease [bacterium]|nr:ABC transporter permease [bacterium]
MMRAVRERVSRYGMLGVLLLLCALFSVLTLRPQHPTGGAAARRLAASISDDAVVLIVARGGEADESFVAELAAELRGAGVEVGGTVAGEPAAIRRTLADFGASAPGPCLVATLENCAPVVRSVLAALPDLEGTTVLTPQPRRWPTFLLRENLLNIANQIAVIAIMAVGMTMVIITGGIDLSVGSLIALSAVVAAWLIERLGGGGASAGGMLAGGLGAVLLCGGVGAFSGLMITRFKVPPFIATLGMMQVASGLAYIISRGMPIYDVPDRFVALGRGADPLLGIPWAVILMLVLYLLAHLLMGRTSLGRYVYAVGGNAEAARLTGVRVGGVLMFVYIACAMLAGLGGVVMASQLKSGAPTYGVMYELYVIAAVVVGGTSLSGGEGRILGTLIGAFIIAVIQNGMNLTNVESYTQKVVLGLVILGAVLLDKLKRR